MACIVIFVDKERLSDGKNFVNIQPNQIIELVQNMVKDAVLGPPGYAP